METLTPQAIIRELDNFIIGQDKAKRAVAIALRNRYRRMQLPEDWRTEITPKNILMIGPTGVGKTEIARRLARLVQAPFLKVEATKFTEVGYVGRDVESIIRELMDASIKLTRQELFTAVQEKAAEAAREKLLDLLVPTISQAPKFGFRNAPSEKTVEDPETRNELRTKLNAGELDNEIVEIELAANLIGVEIMAPPGMEELTSQLQGMFQNLSQDKTKTRKVTVKEALKLLTEEEGQRLLDEEEVRKIALERAEQHGIVFIDEIDKIIDRGSEFSGASVSRSGVQRDLLPLVEGCTVSTKYGPIKTDHILFIASGAFQLAKPSDLVPELQGRLPIRVELDALTTKDFTRILNEPQYSLLKQYQSLLKTESVTLQFESSGVARIAEISFEMNERMENIGARRLHTVLERLLESISFSATEHMGETIIIDAVYVNKELEDIVKNEDLSQYIL